MLQYVLKRILLFIPTLFFISLITFALSQMAPGDPVELKMAGGMQGQGEQLADKLAGEKAYQEMRVKMGLHLPAFYFNISSAAFPDTLFKVPRKNDRKTLKSLIETYGNWKEINTYFKSVKQLEVALYETKRDSTSYEKIRIIRESCNELYRADNEEVINLMISRISEAVRTEQTIQVDSVNTAVVNHTSDIIDDVDAVVANFAAVVEQATPNKRFIPAIQWAGTANQYHRWLFGDVPWFGKNDDPSKTAKGFFRFDFGRSYLDNRPVKSILMDAIQWTIRLNIIAIIISYLISIPLGVQTAVHKDSKFDRISATGLFILYSLPSFWIATLLIVFLTTPEYGMDFFPTYGVGSPDLPDDASWFTQWSDRAYHFILPIFCMTYGSFAFLSRLMRGGMLDVIKQDYIRTAKAKGLDDKTVVWKHAFRNSLIPIITIFANLLPLMISGSVIIEIIFNIPGMGRVSYESVVARNYPVLFTILMFSAILTMVGVLVADILYAVVDPRISFNKKS